MKNKLVEYSKEIAPMYRAKKHQQDLLKDFKESDKKAVELAEAIKEAQQALKDYLESADDSKEILEKIKDIDKDIKEAVSGAVNGTKFKAAEIKAFFAARAKENVDKVVEKGVLFTEFKLLLE